LRFALWIHCQMHRRTPGPVWTLRVVCPRQQSLACCPAAPQLPHCIATMRQETVPAPPAVARHQVAARHTGPAL